LDAEVGIEPTHRDANRSPFGSVVAHAAGYPGVAQLIGASMTAHEADFGNMQKRPCLSV
jgi:hypothetical protein